MLEIAMEKKAQSGHDILYLMQDMRELELYSTVGTVFSVCDSLNYILEEQELAEVFRKFLRQTRISAVVEDRVLEAVGTECLRHLRVTVFSSDPNAPTTLHGYRVCRALNYRASANGITTDIDGIPFRLPAPGVHNAANAAAVCAALTHLGYGMGMIRPAAEAFSGVWRRFDFAGKNRNGTVIYDDYAHNVEKICSCIEAAHEICLEKAVFVFQPHGYGPFGFMREELFPALEKVLQPDDRFCFLPVYYAGGTSSFQPEAEQVAMEYAEKHPGRYLYFADRGCFREYLERNYGIGDLAAIMGARDNSLSDWAKELTNQERI